MTELVLNWSGKVPEESERFMLFVKVGRSADRHCFRRDLGMGSRSEKELDDWEMILDTSFSETEVKELSIARVFFGGLWGDEIVEEDFKAICSLRILSEKIALFSDRVVPATIRAIKSWTRFNLCILLAVADLDSRAGANSWRARAYSWRVWGLCPSGVQGQNPW